MHPVVQIKTFASLLADEIYYTFSFLRHRRGVMRGEIFHQLYAMGYRSAPIVCLITFLIGITISLTSAAQLKMFGADIYLADLIGIAMINELVPLMSGIMLAGKIGASITAEISTMKVMDEIDALTTMGLTPVRFLMVPRLIAITLAVPMLVALADFVGIAGGAIVARTVLGIPIPVFAGQVLSAVDLSDFLTGLGKTLVFGWAVVVAAGYKAFTMERGAESVGKATTESVVLSIALIIGLDCLFAFVLY
ncbi:MAG: ABC transporter permease [Acidobacteriota bacterium]|nr:ABC transporter permease [Acidobacteriota bacterium]